MSNSLIIIHTNLDNAWCLRPLGLSPTFGIYLGGAKLHWLFHQMFKNNWQDNGNNKSYQLMRLPTAGHSLKIDHALSIYDVFHTISGYFATDSFWSKQCGHTLPAKVHWLMPQKLDDNWTNKVSSTCWVPPVCLLGKLISCNLGI